MNFKVGQEIWYRGAKGVICTVNEDIENKEFYLTISLSDYELVSITIDSDSKSSVITPVLRKISSMSDDELRAFCKSIFNRKIIYKPRLRWINGKLMFFAELDGFDRFSCDCMDEKVGKVGISWLKEHNFDVIHRYN